MFRLGGIIVFLLGIVILSIISFRSNMDGAKTKEISRTWVDQELRNQKPQWILPETDLQIVKACSGILDEDFGYENPQPKTILFFQSAQAAPEILSSKIKDLRPWDHRPIEISSLNIKDLNFDLTMKEGIHAEHGQLMDLQQLDFQNRSRLYERLLEEALELCTAHIIDYDQKEIEMEKIRSEIESQATAYLSYDYSTRSKDAEFEVLYELEGLVLRTKIHADSSIL